MTTTRGPGTRVPPSRQATPRTAAPSGRAPSRSGVPREPATAVVPVARLFAAGGANYFLLLGVTVFMVIFGLVMVLSSSTIESYHDDGGFFGRFARQGLFAIIGLPLMLIASRMPATFWKRWAWPALLTGGVLQLLVFTGLGYESGGNRNWISVAGFSAQPSEFVKIALIVWIAWVLSTKEGLLADWKHVALPIAPVAVAAIGFVLIGHDLGTALMMVMIVFGCLYFGGIKFRFLVVAGAAMALMAWLFATANDSRNNRIGIWLNGCLPDDYSGYCWQPEHAKWALAAGGFFGKGLGNSVAKWNWLPESSSDYIFAIIGEELGLIGAVVVLVLFVVLAIAFIRIIRSTRDSFARIATAGVMVWVIGQAFVNISVVLGVLPVLGVPLPLISAGGSALISTLLGIGIVLSFARDSGPIAAPVEQSPAERSRMLAAQRGAAQRVRSRA